MKRSPWWGLFGGAIGAAIGIAIGFALAGDDLHHTYYQNGGAYRFIGMTAAIGMVAGYFIVARLTRGKPVTRDGFTLSYRSAAPTAEGYREMKIIAVADLIEGLTRTGYVPNATACNDFGERSGSIDDKTALQGANVAIRAPGVRGWIRVALAPWNDGQPRALGLVEIWSEGGPSAEELALFTLRVLGGLVDDLAASRESSRLGADPVALLTAGLPDRPQSAR